MSVRASRLLQLALLLFAAVTATFPVLHNKFINWDGRDQITKTLAKRGTVSEISSRYDEMIRLAPAELFC